MGKIKQFFTAKSIKKDYITFTCLSILTALIISVICSGLLQNAQHAILGKYEDYYDYQKHSSTFHGTGDEQTFYIDYMTVGSTQFMTPLEDIVYNVLGILSFAVFPLSFFVCLFIASIIFYKKILQKPLEILAGATDNISENNLDFKISYDRKDELGKLCISFEKMRLALWNSNTELWRQIEERRRLNAAFAHDLRTPLTVLKGQSEMLIKYAPRMTEEKIIETADMMNRHILRLENYVMIMTDLQRLEHIEIQKQPVDRNDLLKQMNTTGTSLCKEKDFRFNNMLSSHTTMELDISIVMQVYENLLANAIRFAKHAITVSVFAADELFQITVSDDGNGFTAKDLTEAVRPFYKSDKESGHEHFGMGLNICKILCEKHGGFLKLENRDGAQVTAAFRCGA